MPEEHLVKYGSYDIEAANEEEEELKSTGGTFLKLGVGENMVRFLPPPVGQKTPFLLVWEHQLNLPDGSFVSFACPKRMGRKPCIVCQKADQLKATGNPADYERAQDLYPRRKVYANIIDRKDADAGPKILGFGKMIHDDIIAIRKDPDFGGDFTHPETGFDIKIVRQGTGRNDTKYKVKRTKQCPLGNLEWIAAQNDLSRYAKILTEAEIRERCGGGSGDTQETKVQVKEETIVDATFDQPDGDDDLPF